MLRTIFGVVIVSHTVSAGDYAITDPVANDSYTANIGATGHSNTYPENLVLKVRQGTTVRQSVSFTSTEGFSGPEADWEATVPEPSGNGWNNGSPFVDAKLELWSAGQKEVEVAIQIQ